MKCQAIDPPEQLNPHGHEMDPPQTYPKFTHVSVGFPKNLVVVHFDEFNRSSSF